MADLQLAPIATSISARRACGAVRLGATVGAAVGGLLAVEALWTAHRPLPARFDLDPSGIIRAEERASGTLRVVALGDSTLTGQGLELAEDVWLRVALERIGHGRAIELDSLAVGGARVADVLGRIDAVAERRPDLVVVAVGANDALHGTPRRAFRTRYDHMLTRLLDEVPAVAAVNIGDLGNIARAPRPLTAVFRARARVMCATIEELVAAHERAVLVDVKPADPVFRDRTIFSPDLFHPGALGHAAWAAAALPGLQLALEQLHR
jgi:lysophospholipase L1-like esterase